MVWWSSPLLLPRAGPGRCAGSGLALLLIDSGPGDSAATVAQVEQRQQEIINSVKNLIEKSEKPIQVNVNPEIKVDTPEIKLDLHFPEEKKSVKKNIKLIRDDKGNVTSAESTEN